MPLTCAQCRWTTWKAAGWRCSTCSTRATPTSLWSAVPATCNKCETVGWGRRSRARGTETPSVLTISTPNLDTASGVAAAGELAALPPSERPTAVFAANDLLAIGVLQGFVTHGLRVPEDVAIIGYDDVSFAASAAVPLSSIRQPRLELGRRAAELLFDEIETSSNGERHEHQAVRFSPDLIVRRSSAVRAQAGKPY